MHFFDQKKKIISLGLNYFLNLFLFFDQKNLFFSFYFFYVGLNGIISSTKIGQNKFNLFILFDLHFRGLTGPTHFLH